MYSALFFFLEQYQIKLATKTSEQKNITALTLLTPSSTVRLYRSRCIHAETSLHVPICPLLFLYLTIFNQPQALGESRGEKDMYRNFFEPGKKAVKAGPFGGLENSHRNQSSNATIQKLRIAEVWSAVPSHPQTRVVVHFKPIARATRKSWISFRSYQHFNLAKKPLFCATLLACITAGSIVVATFFSPPPHAI